MGDKFGDVALSGSFPLAILVSLLAGLAGFLSPCVLPLVPGYVAYVTGLTGRELEQQHRGRVVAGSLLFISGFSLVFVTTLVMGAQIGRTLFNHQRTIEIIGGVLVAGLGIVYMGIIPQLQAEWRISKLPPMGVWAAPIVGVVFALSWTPCVGPTLGAVMQLAIVNGTEQRAALLATAYCAGIGIPFLLFAIFFRRLLGLFRLVRKYNGVVSKAGGLLLIAVGVALATGAWNSFTIWLRVTFSTFGVLV
ncbi:cytochrome c biogenesis CcdA family protein [Micromonospora endolithica]|uniref:Cytochrome c biogenesis protein CcdA n=1 Tax=Micromonospora endolithica TaxID=230091 RepID=A0A3A9Z2H8_9ACTN|nr:cytochrome c biogenesis protein CcdA [Micromonospora endolithica]RKN42084.1 cytochrome c biogenesis protein CcdA [Micromonospora endolithica]TWJ26327.1 cytochrome c-type biogenesis protein [Micromonospora endolithica]